MTAIVEVEHLTKRFAKVEAVRDASFSFPEGGIHGLLGRNGAGKTTLMKLMTGQEFLTSGAIRVFGQSPVENASVLGRVCFINESQAYPENFRGKHALKAASRFFPAWDEAFAQELVADFGPPLKRPIKKMSRGQRSAIGVIIGLASRAELTFFDEPYAGLDAVNSSWIKDGARQLHVTASVGAALSRETDTPESLVRRADCALYKAKRSGRDAFAIAPSVASQDGNDIYA